VFCNQSKGTDAKKVAEKTTLSKTSSGISRLFGNAVKRQPAADAKKLSTGDKTGSPEVNQTVSGSPGRKPVTTVASVEVASTKGIGESRTKAASKTTQKQCVWMLRF